MAKPLPGKPYAEGAQYESPPMAVIDDLAVLAGLWEEPAAPPPGTATLDVGQGQAAVAALLLRANLPSTITLKGPKDLLFSGFTVRLTALELVRNLARPEWGSSRSVTGESTPKQEILFAAPARITAAGFRTRKPLSGAVAVDYKQGPFTTTYVAAMAASATVSYKGQGKAKTKITTTSGYHQQALETHHLRFSLLDEQADLLVASPSLPSRVGLALGDDTPAQLFPTEMERNGTVTSRDLTGAMNAAWQRGVTGETATVRLRITSLTDGVVQVNLGGTWGRSVAGKERELRLDAINSAVLEEAWPFGPAVIDCQARLRLTGQIEGGRRMGMVASPPGFHVRTSEALEVAQAFRLAGGPAPVAKRQLLAVWLLLPGLPRAEERLEIRLAAATGEPIFPVDEPLARLETTLPVDGSAYTAAQGGGYWYRAVLPKPVEIDGTQAAGPLFVVVAGREAGTLLVHRSLGLAPEAAQRIPAGPGPGAALVRNLSRTGQWEVQAFNRQAAHWLVDLELAPTPEEYGGLMAFTCGADPLQALPLAGAGRLALDTPAQLLAQPAGGGPVVVSLRSAVRASVKAQLFLFKPIRT